MKRVNKQQQDFSRLLDEHLNVDQFYYNASFSWNGNLHGGMMEGGGEAPQFDIGGGALRREARNEQRNAVEEEADDTERFDFLFSLA